MFKDGESSKRAELPLAFITISDEQDIKDPKRQQQARTLAIQHSVRRKRRDLQKTNDNFINETGSVVRRRRRHSVLADAASVVESPQRSASLASSLVDPFGTIPVDATRLSQLLQDSSARQAGDPVFSVNNAIEFQGLRTVFNAGLEDPGLASAVCLALAFAANSGNMDRECTAYRLKTIQHVNEKISDPAQATSTTTLGAVLLLVGVEARLGERETAQMHLSGVRQLLLLCNEREVSLGHAVKRAIFWQDLFCSMIAGTTRMFSHETFPEMHWHRDPFQSYLYSIPAGFAERTQALGIEFLDIIGDICALQRLREGAINYPLEILEIEKVDNQQAWIESRLEQLRHTTLEPLLLCCIPAAYLCAYGFFTDIWSGSIIPSRVTTHLLQELQNYEAWPGWDDHSNLLLWLLNIGAAFAIDVRVRLGFAGLWHGIHRVRLQPFSNSWNDIELELKSFIWSNTLYGPRSGAFWNRLQEL